MFIACANVKQHRQFVEELAVKLAQTIPFWVEVLQRYWKNVRDVPAEALNLMRERWEP